MLNQVYLKLRTNKLHEVSNNYIILRMAAVRCLTAFALFDV